MIELPVHQKKLTPTDISQYIRLDRCERFLRLRLHERNEGRGFLKAAGVAAEAIPPILSRSGRAFEEQVLAQIAASAPIVDFAAGTSPQLLSREPDNERFLSTTKELLPGEILVVAQPRLDAMFADWSIRGDADLVRLTRTDTGDLDILIVDVKSSARPKVEHRLQVCFYRLIIEQLLHEAGERVGQSQTGILYRGSAESSLDDEVMAAHRQAACDVLGVSDAFLEIVSNPEAYEYEIRELVTGSQSASRRICDAVAGDLFFTIDYKCDGCLYNEFCLKTAYDDHDLSLTPYMSGRDKRALNGAGIRTIEQLAAMKAMDENGWELRARPEFSETIASLASTSAGPHLDELIARAQRHPLLPRTRTLTQIPNKGHTTLPYSSEFHNPNLIRIYVDVQNDFTVDRVYLVGALIVACEAGVPRQRRSVVRMTDGPSDAGREAALFSGWIIDVLRAVSECAIPDAEGNRRAPIHLIFWNDHGQKALLDALVRNATGMARAAPALFDFVTQMAAFDSPIASFLDAEIRERRNYPMLCQSLQAVAGYLGFAWGDYRHKFRERLFDSVGMTGEEFYTRRARFSSQIPLEYAYAAWGELPEHKPDTFAPYRGVNAAEIMAFEARRLEAIEHVANDFEGNKGTEKTPFNLPDLSQFRDRADNLAQALREFVTVERHADLGAWRSQRQAAPENRVLIGETLIVRYCEEDQAPEIAEMNRQNAERIVLRERYRTEWKAANPHAKRVMLPKDQREESEWSHGGIVFRLRVDCSSVDCGLDALANLINLKDGDRLVLFPRWTYDERLPEDQRVPLTPTPKQMLYGARVDLEKIEVVRETSACGTISAIFAHVRMSDFSGGSAANGFTFPSTHDRPFVPDALYTLDPDPNDIYGMWQSAICDGLCKIESGDIAAHHRLYGLISSEETPPDSHDGTYSTGALSFLAGLDALAAAGAFHDFEAAKREYIAGYTDSPILLVQGPPGTGKSYSTGFALLARVQAAMREGLDCRVFLSCKTHAATDVLLDGVVDAQRTLRKLLASYPEIANRYFDRRILDVPLYRIAGKSAPGDGVTALPKDAARIKGAPKAADVIAAQRYCFVAATPGGTYGMLKAIGDKTNGAFGYSLCDLLVLDEASQMSLPEAMMAALPLAEDGRLIVVGDPRQMPPIIKHDWESEPRRTFAEYKVYRSLFETLQARGTPTIKFTESFRLHCDMAAFLRREIYEKDGIPYFSRSRKALASHDAGDAFVNAVLAPDHALTVVLHDEAGSQSRNAFEQALITPLLKSLSSDRMHGLEATEGLGVVVPHRAQRVALRLAFPELAVIDPETGAVITEAIDTVERYQGAERDVILVSATESDPQYLQGAAAFILDPNRLTVALSRAKKKMVLVASRSIFTYFSSDEQLFNNSQIWKNLLRTTCTEALWEGEREGHHVSVWGNNQGITKEGLAA